MLHPPASVFEELEIRAATLKPDDAAASSTFFRDFEAHVRALEDTLDRDAIVSGLPRTRALAAGSPLVRRAQEWPRGYPGDFETIAHILSAENRAKPHTVGFRVEELFLHSDICRQHREKVERQASLVAQCLAQHASPRILSIGCGTSEDLRRNLPALRDTRAALTLLDADTDALHASRTALAPVAQQVTSLSGHVGRVVQALADTYHLVLIGGVCDYLHDRTITRVLTALRPRVHSGGVLFFTNIDRNNPFRIFMEYLSDWFLIERDEADIRRLVGLGGWSLDTLHLEKDGTGLTHLAALTRR